MCKNEIMNHSVALIGAGRWGKNHLRNFSELGVLQSVCDIDSVVLSSIQKEYPDIHCTDDMNEILLDDAIQGVVIATEANSHAALAKQALACGKDVFIEKPMCQNLSEGRELIDLAARNSAVLMVGHLMHYHPAVIELKRLIQSGALGELQQIRSVRLNTGKRPKNECSLRSFAMHDISIMLSIAGVPSVVSQSYGQQKDVSLFEDIAFELLFAGQLQGYVRAGYNAEHKVRKFMVYGTKATAVFDDTSDKPLTLYYEDRGLPTRNGKNIPVSAVQPLRMECEHFIACMQTRESPCTGGEDGLSVLSTVELIENHWNNSVLEPSLIYAKT